MLLPGAKSCGLAHSDVGRTVVGLLVSAHHVGPGKLGLVVSHHCQQTALAEDTKEALRRVDAVAR